MKIFKNYHNNTDSFLIVPLNHPNLQYKWREKAFIRDNTKKPLLFIGDIINVKKKSIISFGNLNIGFFDSKNNLVTPILITDYNLQKEEYKEVLETLCNEFGSRNPENKFLELIEKANDTQFRDLIIEFTFSNNYENLANHGFDEKIVNDFIDWIKNEDSKTIKKDYHHLIVIKNSLKQIR